MFEKLKKSHKKKKKRKYFKNVKLFNKKQEPRKFLFKKEHDVSLKILEGYLAVFQV